jgi:hypothetical protein
MLANALSTGSMPPERTVCAPRSFPSLAEIAAKRS